MPLEVVVGETEPHCAAEQVTVQVTPLLAESLATLAVTCAVPPACKVALAAVTVIVSGCDLEPQPAKTHTHANASNKYTFFMNSSPYGLMDPRRYESRKIEDYSCVGCPILPDNNKGSLRQWPIVHFKLVL